MRHVRGLYSSSPVPKRSRPCLFRIETISLGKPCQRLTPPTHGCSTAPLQTVPRLVAPRRASSTNYRTPTAVRGFCPPRDSGDSSLDSSLDLTLGRRAAANNTFGSVRPGHPSRPRAGVPGEGTHGKRPASHGCGKSTWSVVSAAVICEMLDVRSTVLRLHHSEYNSSPCQGSVRPAPPQHLFLARRVDHPAREVKARLTPVTHSSTSNGHGVTAQLSPAPTAAVEIRWTRPKVDMFLSKWGGRRTGTAQCRKMACLERFPPAVLL